MTRMDTDPRAAEVTRIGRHLWGVCSHCRRFVKLTGWARGFHVCAETTERLRP